VTSVEATGADTDSFPGGVGMKCPVQLRCGVAALELIARRRLAGIVFEIGPFREGQFFGLLTPREIPKNLRWALEIQNPENNKFAVGRLRGPARGRRPPGFFVFMLLKRRIWK
jgi:hypothetical protein